ncbi:MAG: hypothetical protein IJA86_05860 [Clostridia bacterium]|nr:hypothetical protein [Clostridia bacterium]
MKQKNKKQQNDVSVSAEDIQLYRLYLLFGISIVGFSAFHFLPKKFFYAFQGVGTWIMTVLLLFVLGAFIYIRLYIKPDESKKIVTSSGIAYFAIPVLYMLAFYGHFVNAGLKFQIAFAILSVYSIIYNIYKPNFRNLTAIVLVTLAGLYYIANPVEFLSYRWMEFIFAAVIKVLAVALPSVSLILSVAALTHKDGIIRVRRHVLYEMRDKYVGIASLVLSVVLLAAVAVLFFAPSLFVYVIITVAALYVGTGILCTVRML